MAAWRVEAGLSQAEAGNQLGVAQSVIAKIEGGQRSLMYLEALALAELYGRRATGLDPGAPDPSLSVD